MALACKLWILMVLSPCLGVLKAHPWSCFVLSWSYCGYWNPVNLVNSFGGYCNWNLLKPLLLFIRLLLWTLAEFNSIPFPLHGFFREFDKQILFEALADRFELPRLLAWQVSLSWVNLHIYLRSKHLTVICLPMYDDNSPLKRAGRDHALTTGWCPDDDFARCWPPLNWRGTLYQECWFTNCLYLHVLWATIVGPLLKTTSCAPGFSWTTKSWIRPCGMPWVYGQDGDARSKQVTEALHNIIWSFLLKLPVLFNVSKPHCSTWVKNIFHIKDRISTEIPSASLQTCRR